MSLYDHQKQCTGRVVNRIGKCTLRKCIDANEDMNLAQLQIRSKPVGLGLWSPMTLPFSRLIRGQMLRLSRMPLNFDCGEDNHNTLKCSKINS